MIQLVRKCIQVTSLDKGDKQVNQLANFYMGNLFHIALNMHT